MNAPTDPDVPQEVAFREIREILRTFRDSGWTGMTVDLHGMRITVGKDGPPRGAAAPPGPPAPSAVPTSAPPVAPVVAGPAPAATGTAPAATGTAPAATGTTPPEGPAADLTGVVDVRSPAVGAFWVAPSPGQPPFVAVGQAVAQDDQLAIVEVMKLMNPVVAPVAGTVVEVCAVNADLVEYEQVLFRIRPDGG